MGAVSTEVSPLLREALRSKDRVRRWAASLSFEEKIALLVRMQQRAADISLATRGVHRPVWPMPEVPRE
jgi:hypothetical protein